MKLFHKNPVFETVKLKVIVSLLETVRLSISFSTRNLYNSLESRKEIAFIQWITSYLKNHLTIHVKTFWHFLVASLTRSDDHVINVFSC